MYGLLSALLLLVTELSPFTRAQDPFTPSPGDPFTPALIDQRLEEPLRLLAEVRDRDGQPIGEQYATLVRTIGLTLEVRELRPGLAGSYNIPTRTVTISEAAIREDPKFVAAALAHEIKHADDADFVGLGLLAPDCLEIEARGFEVQAQIARAFWPDQLPTRTDFERELALLVDLREKGGLDALRRWVAAHPGYQQACTG
ncbi:MAG TPA: hypothetical protein VFH48_24565 [Chloroflexota bacterium]|nr:hypothetical protein [Chloroflexota bacterium]